MNKVFLTGYLATDPKQRITSNGIEQSNFNIAVHDIRNFNDNYFFPCVIWGKQAQFANSNLKKGYLVSIDGRLTRRSYIDKDGKTVYIVEIACENIKSFNNKSNESGSYSSSNNSINQVISIDEILNNPQEQEIENNSNEEQDKKFDWEDEL
ncbi:MAG: single-stranded DNA-binding protein [Ureaplasma sp.]|nr:single-stranded DNA-binding protein [Ureaplasma sp.]MDE7221997.1 single-stranded DNA-binding protein [Ureaplasma sp.]